MAMRGRLRPIPANAEYFRRRVQRRSASFWEHTRARQYPAYGGHIQDRNDFLTKMHEELSSDLSAGKPGEVPLRVPVQAPPPVGVTRSLKLLNSVSCAAGRKNLSTSARLPANKAPTQQGVAKSVPSPGSSRRCSLPGSKLQRLYVRMKSST